MSKPRIIIADTDVNYIISLQLKFVEDFFEKIDLEIITEESYFDEFFSSPQKADILIISEDLYSVAIQRHNIAHVFLMMEQYEEDRTGDLRVDCVSKYTSVKEVFNEITSKCADVLSVQSAANKDPQIILVYSAAGGVGKTTIAMGISASLTRNYKRVLYINASYLQSFQHLLENEAMITTADVYGKLSNATDTIYEDIKHVIRKEIFSYLPPFKASLMSLGLKYSIYAKIIKAARKSRDYDFIVVDADVVFNEEKAELISLADKVIVVTDQSVAAVSATNTLVSNINDVSSDKYLFVCNNFDKLADSALISPNITLKFKVTEYIDKFRHYEHMKLDDLCKEGSIQRTAFLII